MLIHTITVTFANQVSLKCFPNVLLYVLVKSQKVRSALYFTLDPFCRVSGFETECDVKVSECCSVKSRRLLGAQEPHIMTPQPSRKSCDRFSGIHIADLFPT